MVILLLFVGWLSFAYAKNSAVMPKEAGGGKTIPVFTPTITAPIVVIAAAGNVTVSSYESVMFGSNINISYDSGTTTYPYAANTPIGVRPDRGVIWVSEACRMIGM